MAVGFFGKQLLKNLIKGGKQKTTGTEVVQPFKFKPSKSKLEKAVKKLEIDTAQQKGKTKKIIQKMENEIEPFRRKLRQTTQKVAGEKVTESGISKGKDRIKKMGGGFMSKRMSYKKGSKFPDLTGDGKVTFADILKGRGVINGKKNKK